MSTFYHIVKTLTRILYWGIGIGILGILIEGVMYEILGFNLGILEGVGNTVLLSLRNFILGICF